MCQMGKRQTSYRRNLARQTAGERGTRRLGQSRQHECVDQLYHEQAVGYHPHPEQHKLHGLVSTGLVTDSCRAMMYHRPSFLSLAQALGYHSSHPHKEQHTDSGQDKSMSGQHRRGADDP